MRRAVLCVLLGLLLVLAATPACRQFDDGEAEALVRLYNRRLIDAFRSSDPRLMDDLCSETEARKLGALIGVKADMGLTLDSQLLHMQVLRVEHKKNAAEVFTQERWRYVDRRMGTGEVVGEASKDQYSMRYRLRRQGERWIVDSVHFETPPQVGRRQAPVRAPVRSLHRTAPAGGLAP